jgi:hypothetical protein
MKPYYFLMIGICISTTALAQSEKQLADVYKTNIPLHQEIVSGGYYVDPPQSIEGDPYFLSKNFEYGSVTINGLKYLEVPLLYNTFSDEIITFHPVHKQKTLIKTDKIDAFDLPENRRFIRIDENPGYSHHGKGFYELVEEGGKANLLCKHYKTTKAKREISKYNSSFEEKFDFLIQKGNQIQEIKSKGQAISFLQLNKKEMKKEAKKENLNYRNNPKQFLSFLVKNYNDSAHE